jgi:hypothetical protein
MIKSNIESSVDIKKIRLNMKKKEEKKMKKLQKKYGTITIELYNNCKNELQYHPTFCYYYTTQATSKYSHLHNIVALYLYQNKNNDLSDSSDSLNSSNSD